MPTPPNTQRACCARQAAMAVRATLLVRTGARLYLQQGGVFTKVVEGVEHLHHHKHAHADGCGVLAAENLAVLRPP